MPNSEMTPFERLITGIVTATEEGNESEIQNGLEKLNKEWTGEEIVFDLRDKDAAKLNAWILEDGINSYAKIEIRVAATILKD